MGKIIAVHWGAEVKRFYSSWHKKQQRYAFLLILWLFSKQTDADIPRIDLLGRAERSQPDLRRKDRGAVGGPGLPSVAEPRSAVHWGAQGHHCHTWTEETNTLLQPPSCCLYPPLTAACAPSKPRQPTTLIFILFCVKFIGLWFLAHERFIPSSFFPY